MVYSDNNESQKEAHQPRRDQGSHPTQSVVHRPQKTLRSIPHSGLPRHRRRHDPYHPSMGGRTMSKQAKVRPVITEKLYYEAYRVTGVDLKMWGFQEALEELIKIAKKAKEADSQ